MGFDEYLSAFGDAIPRDRFVSAEVTEELLGHLEDAALDLQLGGMRREASELEAVRRLGRPELIAEAFKDQPRRLSPAVFRRPRALLAIAALSLGVLGGVAATAAHAQHAPAPVTSTSRL